MGVSAYWVLKGGRRVFAGDVATTKGWGDFGWLLERIPEDEADRFTGIGLAWEEGSTFLVDDLPGELELLEARASGSAKATVRTLLNIVRNRPEVERQTGKECVAFVISADG